MMISMKRFGLILLTFYFLLGGITVASAQTGAISGIILDKTTKEPLVGATVQVLGTTLGIAADLDGKYYLSLEPGTYTLQVRFVGYKDIVRENVNVQGETVLNFEMETDAEVLGEVKVRGKKNRENERVLQLERQEASIAIENIGAKEMSLKGASNVQEGVKKITGISIAGAGQLIVRGLGDRYSTTTLNGLPIASPNPDNKLIPLDLFPSSTVQNITVSKVYEVSTFADYSGAHIDIGTKTAGGTDFLSLGVSTGAAFNTIGKDFYFSDRQGNLLKTGNLDHAYLDMSYADFREVVRERDIFGTSFAIDNKTA